MYVVIASFLALSIYFGYLNSGEKFSEMQTAKKIEFDYNFDEWLRLDNDLLVCVNTHEQPRVIWTNYSVVGRKYLRSYEHLIIIFSESAKFNLSTFDCSRNQVRVNNSIVEFNRDSQEQWTYRAGEHLITIKPSNAEIDGLNFKSVSEWGH